MPYLLERNEENGNFTNPCTRKYLKSTASFLARCVLYRDTSVSEGQVN